MATRAENDERELLLIKMWESIAGKLHRLLVQGPFNVFETSALCHLIEDEIRNLQDGKAPAWQPEFENADGTSILEHFRKK